MYRAWLVILAIAGACSSKDAPPPVAPIVVRDAGVAMDGITTIGHFDPASGMHLDDDAPNPVLPRPNRTPGKPVDITIRSSPPGAMAAVDGHQIGRTPTYASVPSGVPHDFTFVLDGYAAARYHFVPIQSGVVHATMEAVSSEVDAGVALPPEMTRAAPPPEPRPAVTPPPPPTTLVAPPPDAAVPSDSAAPSGTGPAPF